MIIANRRREGEEKIITESVELFFFFLKISFSMKRNFEDKNAEILRQDKD